jgi:glucosamine 6-phosphate synthetase-like amidotransferase/phosphosugar isomerase protein
MVVIATAIETGSVAQAENVWPATKEGVMSSDTNILIFQPDRTRILNRILSNAKYVTENMRPLSGHLRERSKTVLKHFMAGVIIDAVHTFTPSTEPYAAFANREHQNNRIGTNHLSYGKPHHVKRNNAQ